MEAVVETSETTDEQLAAEAAREGSDGPAFLALVNRHQQRVWHLCYRLMGNEHDAADATQEVFVRLFVNRARFEGRSKFTTWLHGIAIRTCLSLRRSKGRRRKHESSVDSQLLEQQVSGDEDAPPSMVIDLYEMLGELSEEDRAMVILKYAESYTFEELANLFDMNVSACKMRVSRAREKIHAKYGEKT